jgi:AcrR family transcriptional regulator
MSPRSKEQFEQIKDERREQLLLAALKVFSRRGLAATKIGDIASEAGLSHGLVYHYFQSKDEIFTELVRRAAQSSAYALLQAEQMPLAPLEKIKEINRMVLQSISTTNEAAYYFFLMVQAMISDTIPAEAQQYVHNVTVPTEVLMRIIIAGQATGEIHPGNPYDYVMAYWSTIQGLAVYKITAGDRFVLPDPELLVRMFEPK